MTNKKEEKEITVVNIVVSTRYMPILPARIYMENI